MKRKYLVAALSLLLLIAVVATGIHFLNKEARADTFLICKLIDNGNPVQIEGMLHVHFYLDDEVIEAGAMEIDGNRFSYWGPPQTNYDHWDVSIEFGADPVNPVDSPHLMLNTQTMLEWEVDAW